LTAAASFIVCALPGVVTTAAIYERLFGSPFTSGYGDLSGFFALGHVLPNVRLYLSWYCESQSRLTLLGVARCACRSAPSGRGSRIDARCG
jgi:hypothetical protein